MIPRGEENEFEKKKNEKIEILVEVTILPFSISTENTRLKR